MEIVAAGGGCASPDHRAAGVTGNASPIRVVIADDHLLFRQGLKALLKEEPEVGRRRRDRSRRPSYRTLVWRGSVRSASARPADGAATRWPTSSALAERVPIVVLTASEAPADALAAIRARRARRGPQALRRRDVMDAIRSVARKATCGCRRAADASWPRVCRSPSPSSSPRAKSRSFATSPSGCATPRSRKKLSISEQTVKAHLNTIFRKLRHPRSRRAHPLRRPRRHHQRRANRPAEGVARARVRRLRPARCHAPEEELMRRTARSPPALECLRVHAASVGLIRLVL